MRDQTVSDHSRYGLSRRSLIRSTAALLSIPFVAKATAAWTEEKLAGSGEVVYFSFGGSFTEGAQRNVFDPVTKATGIKVVSVTGQNSEPLIKAMHQAGRVDWDITTLTARAYRDMHDAGMFVPVDYGLWDDESNEGVQAQARFKDAVVGYLYAMALAYDQRAFPKGGPKNWVDFWNVKNFPGPRGLYATEAKFSCPPALLAAGVAPKDIWPLTDDKLDRAFEKLNEIKPHVTKWWTAGGEAPQLLINREYAMTAAYDGRLVSAISQGAPIKLIWDGACLNYAYSVILKGGPNTTNAQKLLAFMNRAQIAAAWTQGTGYAAPNTNQLKYLPAELSPLLAVNPENSSKCIVEDAAWLAAKRPDGRTNLDHLQERWLSWRAQ